MTYFFKEEGAGEEKIKTCSVGPMSDHFFSIMTIEVGNTINKRKGKS